jgi:hypothetical protein
MDFMNGIGGGIFALVALPFILVAIGVFVVVLRARRKVRSSQNWLSTNGHVQMSYIEPRTSHSSEGGTSTSYYPVVLYEYIVNGQRYQSNRIRFGMEVGYGWTQPAQNLVNKYPAGSVPQVFYNPADPTDAVLERTASTSNRVLTCVVIVIILTLVFTAVMMLGAFSFIPDFMSNMFPQ